MTSSVKKYEIVVLEQNTNFTGVPCAQCNAVIRKLEAANKPYLLSYIQDDDGNVHDHALPYVELAKERGFSSAPIVVLLGSDGESATDIFGGYNPAKLKEFMSYV